MSEVPLYAIHFTTADRKDNTLKGKDVCLTNGSSQGQNLALTVLYVPKWLHSGEGISSDALADLWYASRQLKTTIWLAAGAAWPGGGRACDARRGGGGVACFQARGLRECR